MPDADLTLDGGNAIVDGNWLTVRCWDVKLDAADRRTSAGGERRALVHGFEDELVVNYGGDYPGGVTLRGDLRIPEKIKQPRLRLESHDLYLDHPDRRSATGGLRRALVHGFEDELVVNYGNDYPGGVTLRGELRIPEKVKQARLHLETHDLRLDHPDRRSSPDGLRRAMVHGFNDELVLNWAKDYPGGTVVHGTLELQRSGRLRLRNATGDVVVEANADGNLSLGGHGTDGDLMCKDAAGATRIHVDTQANRIDFKGGSGAPVLRIDADHASAAPWPAFPDESPTSRVDLVAELRRVKEVVVALRAEVAELTTPTP